MKKAGPSESQNDSLQVMQPTCSKADSNSFELVVSHI